MRYDEIFGDMVGNVMQDYAGFKEKEARHDFDTISAACRMAQENGQLNDLIFMQLMNQYLVMMQDRNLKFRLRDGEGYQASTCGFDVRSYQGRLYVSRVNEETRVRPGDQLIILDTTPPALCRKRFQDKAFGSDVEERELWGPFLKMASRCMVKHMDGTDENVTLKKYPLKTKLPRLGGRLIGKDTLYLDLPHFIDGEAVTKLLAAKEKSLGRCRRLILDLRHNAGGSEEAFFPLLDYIFPEPVLLRDIYEEKGFYTNYTEKNCNRKIRMLENYLPAAEAELKVLAESLIEEMKEKSGQGMVWEPDEELLEDETMVGGLGCFEKVIILSDTYCEYAGETFIQICKKSPRVTVVGRPTMGNIDYCNQISILYNDRFTFSYPMSKTRAAMEGKGVSGKGVPVDVYIPWTPAECTQDVLLETALQI